VRLLLYGVGPTFSGSAKKSWNKKQTKQKFINQKPPKKKKEKRRKCFRSGSSEMDGNEWKGENSMLSLLLRRRRLRLRGRWGASRFVELIKSKCDNTRTTTDEPSHVEELVSALIRLKQRATIDEDARDTEYNVSIFERPFFPGHMSTTPLIISRFCSPPLLYILFTGAKGTSENMPTRKPSTRRKGNILPERKQ
jgi:hypothetical protein